jgi:hypothetical protein
MEDEDDFENLRKRVKRLEIGLMVAVVIAVVAICMCLFRPLELVSPQKKMDGNRNVMVKSASMAGPEAVSKGSTQAEPQGSQQQNSMKSGDDVHQGNRGQELRGGEERPPEPPEGAEPPQGVRRQQVEETTVTVNCPRCGTPCVATFRNHTTGGKNVICNHCSSTFSVVYDYDEKLTISRVI